MESQTLIRRSNRAVFRELVDGTGVVLNLDTAAYHGLNRLGTLIWTLLGAETSFGQLVSEVRNRLLKAPPNLDDDVAGFLDGLQERDLVLVSPPAAEDRKEASHF